MEGDDAIPIVEIYKGIGLEDQQSPERLEVVRREIDVVLGMTDPSELARWAENSWHSPESRRLAAAMAETAWMIATETRSLRPPGISLEKLHAAIAGLNSRRWRDPLHHCSLLDAAGGIERELPLDDAE